MTTINRINQIVRTTNNTISYRTLDEAADQIRDAYVRDNLTFIGYDAGTNRSGYVSITTQIDYDLDLVYGDSLAVLKGTNLPGTNVAVDPSDLSTSLQNQSYALNYDPVTGCDPMWADGSLEETDVGRLISDNTIRETIPINLNRHVITGAMTSIRASMTFLNGRKGPWGATEFGINAGIPAIAVTNGEIDETVSALSPIL